MPRTPLIAGNWKMNGSIKEAVPLAQGIVQQLDAISGVEVVVCPPSIYLSAVSDVLRGSAVRLGAQNMHQMEKGAYTGEISPMMVAEICQYVTLGHSERRQYFCETDETVNQKVKAALEHNLMPIVCVGENLEQREGGQTESFIASQVRGAFNDVTWNSAIIVAYEPIWAIGTGRAATGETAQDTVAGIRRVLASIFGNDAVQQVRILYGGSVTPDNIKEYISQPDIDGALVGGASLNPASFAGIVKGSAAAR
ncbi:MAG: triose-phosphate isomerase [Dehalococcoidia bacterium]|nr:triose-phosphate isomerase [Dehalococcoidia bacterium]